MGASPNSTSLGLPPESLRRRCDPQGLPFETTAELPELPEGLGQERAVEAVRFGIGIRRYGYNVYAMGPSGMGKHGLVRRFLESQAAAEAVPSDWCYVASFQEPHKPRALRLPPGRGVALRRDVEQLVEELKASIPAAFESEDYRTRKKLLESRFAEKSEGPFVEIEREAQERGILVVRTPVGVALAPARGGEAIDPDEFLRLPQEEQERAREAMKQLQERFHDAAASLPREAREHREAVRQLDRDVTAFAVGHLVDEVKARWSDVPDALAHLEALQQDVLENADDFRDDARHSGPDALLALLSRKPAAGSFRRYAVNVLVDNGASRGAPVVYDDHPSHASLVGRIEHLAELGSLVTDFRLIRAGDLHRANGGYLIVDARKVLLQPLAWDELKRALRSRQVRIESLAQTLGLATTASLDPEPIPLELKVVLVGERLVYYLLAEHDPEFLELFKVAADFDEVVPRTAEAELGYARLLATLARREGLRPLDRGGAARAIEHGARLAADSERLSVHAENLADVLREADHAAAAAGRPLLAREDVQAAIDGQLRRSGRVHDRVLEEMRRGTILIDTAGTRVGQVNGLSVLQLGPVALGRPSRITARARLGAGRVVDIEREVALGGPIHSKGVLILAGFLGARYSPESPLSLHASLVFEQSYSGVEGDSASCGELVALLSALAEVPVRQALAITGSVNQHGEVQPVGGVNEKIEGFFDLCAARGPAPDQGVVIPASNVKHLMLRDDVVRAVAEGRFRVWAVESVDQALELLTGVPAGLRDAGGAFPEGSLNRRVQDRLAAFAEKARAFGQAEPAEAAATPRAGGPEEPR